MTQQIFDMDLNKRLTSIQVGRALAVLTVLLFHLNFEAKRVWGERGSNFLSPIFDCGCTGVDIFFVISGFIIIWVYADTPHKVINVLEYLWHRFTRIYPIYILYSIPSFIQGLWNHQLNWKTLPATMALVWPYPLLANPVAWSLSYEISFYLLFAIAFLLPPRFIPFLAAAWAGSIACNLSEANPHKMPEVLYPTFSALSLEILLGVAAAMLIKARLVYLPRVSLAIGASLVAFFVVLNFYAGHMLAYDFVIRLGTIGVAAFFLIYGCVGDQLKNATRYWKWLEYVGTASYSIYLMHMQIIVFASMFAAAHKHIPPLLWQVATGAISLGAGITLFEYVEKPLLNVVHKKRTVQEVSLPTNEPEPVLVSVK